MKPQWQQPDRCRSCDNRPLGPARRAHPPLSARLSLLLESARARSARGRTGYRDLGARFPRGGRARRAAGASVGRRAGARGAISSRSPPRAHAAGLYTNLITSAVGITHGDASATLPKPGSITCRSRSRTARLPRPTTSPATTGALRSKAALAAEVVRLKLPLTVNAVMHRANIDRIGDMVELALELGRRPRRDRARAVLWMGAQEPRRTDADRAQQVERAASWSRSCAARITAASSSMPWCRTTMRAIRSLASAAGAGARST